MGVVACLGRLARGASFCRFVAPRREPSHLSQPACRRHGRPSSASHRITSHLTATASRLAFDGPPPLAPRIDRGRRNLLARRSEKLHGRLALRAALHVASAGSCQEGFYLVARPVRAAVEVARPKLNHHGRAPSE